MPTTESCATGTSMGQDNSGNRGRADREPLCRELGLPVKPRVRGVLLPCGLALLKLVAGLRSGCWVIQASHFAYRENRAPALAAMQGRLE